MVSVNSAGPGWARASVESVFCTDRQIFFSILAVFFRLSMYA